MENIIKAKKAFRLYLKEKRNKIKKAQKSKFDYLIFKNIISLPEYKKAKIVCAYVSFGSEVETFNILKHAQEQKKIIATPVCQNDNTMNFYIITEINNLIRNKWGILEPVAIKENLINNFEQSLLLVPGLGFDYNGNRIGYGKGFYDKFLQDFNGISCGLCYNQLLNKDLICEPLDKCVNILVTQRKIYRFDK